MALYNNRGGTVYRKNGPLTFPKPIAKPEYASNAHGPFPPVTNCEQVTTSSLGWIAPYVTFALGSASQRMYDNDDDYATRFGDTVEIHIFLFINNGKFSKK